MSVYTTEIASDKITSDNPLHQRLLKAYYLAQPYVKGDLLEVGCGEGRGVELLAPMCNSYVAIDKIGEVINKLQEKHPKVRFIHTSVPPFKVLKENTFDIVVSFQVIEHIKQDRYFLEEIYRVLKPGGMSLVTTPNKIKSLTRNPWHIREYTAEELSNLAGSIFDEVEMKGVTGSSRVWEYYEENKKAVKKITRFDLFNLQYRLPAALLRLPYDLLNRLNRNNLEKSDNRLVACIKLDDYLLSEDPATSLDLFGILRKI